MERTHLIMAGIAVVSLAAGGAGGYILAEKRLRAHYDEISRKEISEVRTYYRRKHKEGEFETPASAAAVLLPASENEFTESTPDPKLEAATSALHTYQGEGSGDIPETDEEAERLQREHEENVIKRQNVFRTHSEWNQELEMAKRSADAPYILSQEEFFENETEYEQVTVTYYQGDDVLADSTDQEVRDSDRQVGDINLTRWGHGSGDPNVIYIRNERLELEYEVLREGGKFTEIVLGFHEPAERERPMKFRGGRDD